MRVLWLLVLLVGAAWAEPGPARRAIDDHRPLAAQRLAGRSFAEQLVQVRALAELGLRSDARRRLEALGRPPEADRFDFHLIRGQLLGSKQDYDLARKDLREASRLADTRREQAEALLERAFLEVQAEETDEAARLYGEAVRVAPASLGLQLARVQLEVLAAKGDLDGARGTALTGLALARERGLRGSQVVFLLKLAMLAEGQQDYVAARASFRAALELALGLREPSLVLQALSHRQSVVLNRHQETAEHLALLQQMLSRLSRPEDLARVSQLLAALQLHLRQVDQAGATYRRSQQWARQSGDAREMLRAQAAWARFLYRSDRVGEEGWRAEYARALRLAERLTIDSDDAGLPHPAFLHLKLAESYSSDKALPHLEKALALAAPTDRASTAAQMLAWALRFKKLKPARQALDQFFAALPACPRASDRASLCVQISNSLFLPDFTEQILTGQTSFRLDDVRRALAAELTPERFRTLTDEAERVVARSRARSEPDRVWSAFFMQGLLLDAQGRHAESLDAMARSAEAARAGQLDQLAAISWQLSGLILLEEKRYLEAAETFEKSIRLAAEELPLIASGSLMVLAQTHRARGAPGDALAAAERAVALRLREKRISPHVGAWIEAERGHCLIDLGRFPEAVAAYREAGRLMTAAKQTWYRTQVQSREAAALALSGHLEEAARLYAALLPAAQGRLRFLEELSVDYGPVLEKLGRPDEARQIYERAYEASRELRASLPDLDDELDGRLIEQGVALEMSQHQPQAAQRWLERGRSLERVRRVTAQERAGLDEHTRLALERAEELREGLAGLHQQLAANGSGEVASQLADTRAQFLMAVNEVKQHNPDFESLLTVRESELVRVQERLPADVLLLQFYPAPEALYLLVVTRQGFEMRSVKVARTRLYALLREFRQLLSEHSKSERLAEVGSLLYSLTLAPVRAELKGRRLRVIPSGLLWYLPLEALKDEEGRYLAETTEVSYLTGLDLLAAPAAHVPERPVAVGAPIGLDLPGTRTELARLKAVLPSTQVLEGAEATRAALLERAASADVLHIASHSQLDRQNVNGTYIQLSGEKLTLGDIYRLRLAPDSLVVLSSCESGLGEDNPGREFASLAAAFRMAGASAVVSTLWKVHDDVGPELFAEFYRQLQAGAGRARALQLAKLACLRKGGFEHPGDWAAYTLLGD